MFEKGVKQAQERVANGSSRASIKVDAGYYARDRAARASQDSFRTAAKNVINYKRSGGNLKDLNYPVMDVGRNVLETAFEKRKY